MQTGRLRNCNPIFFFQRLSHASQAAGRVFPINWGKADSERGERMWNPAVVRRCLLYKSIALVISSDDMCNSNATSVQLVEARGHC